MNTIKSLGGITVMLITVKCCKLIICREDLCAYGMTKYEGKILL